MTKGYIPTIIAFELQVRMHSSAEMYLSRAILSGGALAT
jgi:hypothetical protein